MLIIELWLRFGTKTGLAGGACYIYYDAGLWKNSDETIVNYEQFKKDVVSAYNKTPEDVQKWGEYCKSTVSVNVEPYSKVFMNRPLLKLLNTNCC
jgi:hypothetical protein